MRHLGLGITFGALLAACSTGSRAPTMTLSSAPLTLPGIGAACYDISVTNAANGEGETVWARGTPNHQVPDGADTPESGDPEAICSGRYGNGDGGAITYVGTCDAGPTGTRTNSVTIWLDGLYYGPERGNTYIAPDGPDGWRDPCGTSGCTLNVTCRENQDVPVDFNLTLMRDAQQGFFDLAVGFEDVFCSAKADSCYDLSTPIRQLFGDDMNDPAGRDHTAVIGLACTAGPDRVNAQGERVDVATELVMSQPVIACENGIVFSLPLDTLTSGLATLASNTGGHTLHYATFSGTEALSCGVAPANGEPLSCNKAYYNIAIDLENLAGQGLRDCAFTMAGTAQDAESRVFSPTTGALLDDHATYGAVRFDVSLVDGTGPLCDAHPLDGTSLTGAPSQVTTGYVFGAAFSAMAGALPNDFLYFARDGAAPTKATPPAADCPCWQRADLAASLSSVLGTTNSALEYAFEGTPSGEFEAELEHDDASLEAWVSGDTCGFVYSSTTTTEQRVEALGLTSAQVAACAADSSVFVGPADACPCFDTATVLTQAQVVRATEGYDFRAEHIPGLMAAVEIANANGGVFITSDLDDAECEFELEGALLGHEVEVQFEGLQPSQVDACIAGIAVVKTTACTGDPGTCADQLCNAGTGGAWQCLVCPCWDFAQVQAEAQALRTGAGYQFGFTISEPQTLSSGDFSLSASWDTQSCGYTNGVDAPVALSGLAYDLVAACSDDLWNLALETCTLAEGFVCSDGVACAPATAGQWQCIVP